MRPWTRVAFAVATAAVAATPLSAQVELIGFERVHQLFNAKDNRAAARELRQVSVEFRNEIGRCRDETLGARLMELEPKFDVLAGRITAGTLTTASTLEEEFAVIDRLLALNHQQLAATAWGFRRFGRLEGVAADLAVSARYIVRAGRWSHEPLAEPMQKLVNDALAIAERIKADPANPPAETGAVIEALGKALKGTS
jgi:hypothetical protein